MQEKERKIIDKLAEALPDMDDFDKGYLLGIVERTKKDEENDSERSGFNEYILKQIVGHSTQDITEKVLSLMHLGHLKIV